MLWYFGGGFGVWTVMDGNLECQLWSTLFFAHNLDPSLHAARATSMISMLSGLAALAVLTQSLSLWANRICVIGLLVWMGSSYGTLARFNLWSTFFGLTYVLFIVAARYLRHYYGSLGNRRIVRFLMGMALLFCLGIFSMLAGSVCSCAHLRQVVESGWFFTSYADDDWPVDLDNCMDSCQILSSSPIIAPVFWFMAWLLVPYCWVVHEDRKVDSDELQSMPSTIVESDDETPATVPQQTTVAEMVGEKSQDSIEPLNTSTSEVECGKSMNEAASELSHDEVDEVAEMEQMQPNQVPRTRHWLHWCVRLLLLSVLLIIYAFLVVVMIGAYVENANAAKAPDTSHNFVVDTVLRREPTGSP